MRTSILLGSAVFALMLASAGGAAAQDDAAAAGAPNNGGHAAAAPDDQGGYFAHWFDRVREAQAGQPHWITPVATVTPRLEQEFRFDAGFQQAGNGAHLDNYGMGKGLELIPTTSNEIILNLPPYETRSVKKAAKGWGDDPVLLVKQRLVSANEDKGDYIVTAFLGVQAPTGSEPFTNHAWVITPTLAAGKGWGPSDVQATLGAALPLSHESEIGKSVVGNVAFQYHLAGVFWPEFEINATHWTDGPRGGKTQLFLTPGVIFGRFPIAGRTNLILGVAYQFAVSPRLVTTPVLTPVYDRQLLLTTRVTF